MPRLRPDWIALLVPALSLAACSADPASDTVAPDTFESELVASGRDIVDAQCAACHAVGLTGTSPRGDAPPLRLVLARYSADALADEFREGIHVGHPDMPDFDFGPLGTDAVITYLQSIQGDADAK
ncbi:MAG: cytochrome c [Pseudomonadota bacterium]